MGDEDAYFRIMDEALKHPDGRANGGEPCVICNEPIPRDAHWVQRDRHVCSSRCNGLLRRRYGRGSPTIDQARTLAALEAAGPKPNPRASGPRIFATVRDPGPRQLPIEWEGYGPQPGDIVERYGILTAYDVQDIPSGHWTERVLVACVQSGDAFATGATPEGFGTSLVLGAYDATGRVGNGIDSHRFICQGVQCEWRRERVTDLHPDGIYHFHWECYAAVPVGAPPYPEPMHSPRYRAEMDRRQRVASSTARHERRAREEAKIERFDPLDVFERDGWICQLCGSEVDREVLYPDPWSASLDHVIPLSRGGDHTMANVALAHLRCNIEKRATLLD